MLRLLGLLSLSFLILASGVGLVQATNPAEVVTVRRGSTPTHLQATCTAGGSVAVATATQTTSAQRCVFSNTSVTAGNDIILCVGAACAADTAGTQIKAIASGGTSDRLILENCRATIFSCKRSAAAVGDAVVDVLIELSGN